MFLHGFKSDCFLNASRAFIRSAASCAAWQLLWPEPTYGYVAMTLIRGMEKKMETTVSNNFKFGSKSLGSGRLSKWLNNGDYCGYKYTLIPPDPQRSGAPSRNFRGNLPWHVADWPEAPGLDLTGFNKRSPQLDTQYIYIHPPMCLRNPMYTHQNLWETKGS